MINKMEYKLFQLFSSTTAGRRKKLVPRVIEAALVDEEGDSNAAALLCWHFQTLSSKADFKRSLEWGDKAIGNGSNDAFYHSALAIWGLDPESPVIRHRLRLAVKKSLRFRTRAQADLGLMYEYGIGGTVSIRWAGYWYEKAALAQEECMLRILSEFKERFAR